MIKDYFMLALKNLRRRKLRSWLTMIGIFVSIAIIFSLISLSLGLSSAITEQVRSLGADKFFIYPSLSAGIPGANNPVNMTTSDFDIVSRVSGVKSATYMISENGKLEFANKIRYAFILGFPLTKESTKVLIESSNLKMDEGRFLESGDSYAVDLGSEYKYGSVFPTPVKTGDNIKINNTSFKVIGILASVGNPQDDSQVYIGIDEAKALFSSGNRVDYMIVQVQAGVNVKEVASRVEKKLREFRDVTEKTQDFSVVTPEELLRSFSNILNIITAFLIAVAAISLIVGAVGITNTMYTSVLERYREIGVMKAVGAKNSDVLFIFLFESGLLGLVGGIIGIIFGIVISKSVEYAAVTQLHTTLLRAAIPSYLVISCLLFAFIIGAVSGTFPAWQASRIKPVQALRYE